MKHVALSYLALALLTLTACGNDYPLYQPTGATATNANTSSPAATGGTQCGTGSSTIGYAAYAATVFNTYCVTGCHVAGGTDAALPMDTEANAQASLTPSDVFIVGNGMPLSGYPQLSANQVCILQQWVAQNYPQ